MHKITVVAVGKLKERFWRDACNEYLKRLGAYAKVQVRELADSNRENEARLIAEELDKLSSDASVVLLDIEGTPTSSEQLAAFIEEAGLQGCSHIVFIIGGSDGVTDAVRARVDRRMSFGPCTLPHNLARVVLLEQIYRSFKIIRGEPYHK